MDILGHEVNLIPTQDVQPSVRGNKNDVNELTAQVNQIRSLFNEYGLVVSQRIEDGDQQLINNTLVLRCLDYRNMALPGDQLSAKCKNGLPAMP